MHVWWALKEKYESEMNTVKSEEETERKRLEEEKEQEEKEKEIIDSRAEAEGKSSNLDLDEAKTDAVDHELGPADIETIKIEESLKDSGEKVDKKDTESKPIDPIEQQVKNATSLFKKSVRDVTKSISRRGMLRCDP